VALSVVVTNRTRISVLTCLALTLGTIVNVFGLQAVHRQPLAAVAEAFPGGPGPIVATAISPLKPTVKAGAGSTSSRDPALQLQASADADLSVRTASIDRATTDLSTPEVAPADAKLTASIQRELTDRGYGCGAINGKAGLMTRSAIMAFEFDQHFQLTGEPSDELLRRILLGLTAGTNDPLLPPGEKAGRIIAGAQRLLRRLGYDPGQVNGQLTEPMRKALRMFEADAGMIPKGRVSGEVMAEITRRAHARIEVYDEALSR
jgi:peptidoglycan hydrolase-like protein with peptidoglycan-binding domain